MCTSTKQQNKHPEPIRASLFSSSSPERTNRLVFVPKTTRERILLTALELIGESGIRGFSLNAVLRKGRFSKGSFFFHFKGIDDLCLSCYELIRQFMLPQINADDYENLRDFLEAFGKETLLAIQTRQYFLLIYFFSELAMTNQEFQRAQRELTEHYQARLAIALRKFAGPKEDEQIILDMVAYMSIVMDGIAAQRIMFDDPDRMSRVWPIVIDNVIRELA